MKFNLIPREMGNILSSIESLFGKNNSFDDDDAAQAKLRFSVRWNEAEKKFRIIFDDFSLLLESENIGKRSYSTSMTLEELNLAHQNLMKLNTEIESTFPNIPDGCWSDYLFLSAHKREANDTKSSRYSSNTDLTNFDSNSSIDMEKFSFRIENYLNVVYRKCSHISLMSCLFPKDFVMEEYIGNMEESREKVYLEKLSTAKANYEILLSDRNLQRDNVARRESNSSTNDGLKSFSFSQLCKSLDDVMELNAEYYAYLKQPFLNLREISTEKIRYSLNIMQSPVFDEKQDRDAMKDKLAQHQNEYRSSDENLRNLQLRYCNESRKLLTGFIEALRKEAKLPYRGVDLITLNTKIVEAERLLSFHNMNYLALAIVPIRLEKKRLEQKISQLNLSSPNLGSTLESLEKDMFSIESFYMTVNIRLLEEKENYLHLQSTDRKKFAELLFSEDATEDDTDLFFDAVESEYELQKFFEHCSMPSPMMKKNDLELINQKLESFKNKKLKLESKMTEGCLLSSFASEQSSSELNKILEFENQRKKSLDERLKCDRQIAIQLIREYRYNKIPDPAISMKLSNDIDIYANNFSNTTADVDTFSGSKRGATETFTATKLSPPSSSAPLPESTVTANGTNLLAEKSTTVAPELSSEVGATDYPPPPPPPPPPATPVAVVYPLESANKNTTDAKNDESEAHVAMNSVIDQIKNGTVQLKKVDKTAMDDNRSHDLEKSVIKREVVQNSDLQNEVLDAMDSVIDELKNGIVHLKEVDKDALDETKKSKGTDPGSKLLHATMSKIKKASNLSVSDGSDDGSDFDD